jgi:hypothetical protein
MYLDLSDFMDGHLASETGADTMYRLQMYFVFTQRHRRT